jgi:prepilin-type N-terminal cleavage/methylation domain-containing protein
MPGFTLIEVMVSIAIVGLLMGLVYAGLAPARERAREMHCLNNLHQIGRAIQMYRQDYGGQEPPGALTTAQLGLPRHATLLLPHLAGNRVVFRCPNENEPSHNAPRDPFGLRISYMYSIRPEEWPLPSDIPAFSERVARRGNDTPLLSDIYHSQMLKAGYAGGPKRIRRIVLRLGGQVDVSTVSWDTPSWEW